MEFDVVEISESELKNFSAVQMQLLRTAQKSKNELLHKKEKSFALFKKQVYTDDMKESSLLAQKEAELQSEYEYQLNIIVEQYLYSMGLITAGRPDPDSVEYLVDYSLSYTDRYNIVRAYYMSIPDANKRLQLYEKDQVANDYLGSYYGALYNVLYSYTK